MSTVPKTRKRCTYVPELMECLFQNEEMQFFWRNQGLEELSAFSTKVLSDMAVKNPFPYLNELDNYNFVQLRYQKGVPVDLYYNYFPRLIRQHGEQAIQFAESRVFLLDSVGKDVCDLHSLFQIISTSLPCDMTSTETD